MKKFQMIVFTALLYFAFASTAHAAASDLLQLLGNKQFWSCFNWGKFTESDLHKATEWREPGYPFRSGVTVTNSYTIEIAWPELHINKMEIYENSDRFGPNHEPKDLRLIYGTSVNDQPMDHYNALVNWCSQNFGEPQIRDQKSERATGKGAITTMRSLWTVGKTEVSVTTEDGFFGDLHLYVTKLQFEKNTESSPTAEYCNKGQTSE